MQKRINNIGSSGSGSDSGSDSGSGSGSGSSPGSLPAIQAEIKGVLDCIDGKIIDITTSTNTVFNRQYDIPTLEAEIEKEQVSMEISKRRLEYIRHPEKNTSPYQSWFPIDRPIQPITLITLITLTIFLSVFALLIALSAIGIDLTIITRLDSSINANRYGMYYWLKSQLTVSSFVLVVILLAVIIYFVKRS
jgi:hypothetical protein